ncbi:hypothetical protein J2S74_005416 [Evansella vedderi]|uniref:Uncharacterized protein n=1 Tax=Evansella vedderi TaxID=38282 RepID=A0ABU0A384_9BACI|nr:hypothetical protein [Evansella vedderi]MDQ0257953.1 hypothetical protein [Evansella vedderi]
MAKKTQLAIRCAEVGEDVQCMDTGNGYDVEKVFDDGSVSVGTRFNIMTCSTELIVLEPYNYWVVEQVEAAEEGINVTIVDE